MLERVRFIAHKQKKILHLNFAQYRQDEVLPVIDKAKSAIKTNPPKSVFTLGAGFNARVFDAMQEFVRHNNPRVTDPKLIILNAVMKFSGRHLHAFDSPDEAKDWLAKQ